VKPLKCFLQARLELQLKDDRTPSTELAGAGEFACALLHAFQGLTHVHTQIRLGVTNVLGMIIALIGVGKSRRLGITPNAYLCLE
jgi:hypothetical protein